MLYLPAGLPAAHILTTETSTYDIADAATVRHRYEILLLNLMPEKARTELDIARMLAATGEDIRLHLIRMAQQPCKTTPAVYMDTYYRDFDAAAAGTYDALIVTGAPVEHLPFSEVTYWESLCRVMDWAGQNVARRLYICWAAQAALYHHYGIEKTALPQKMFGIFRQQVCQPDAPLMDGLSPEFSMPGSRHTGIDAADIRRHHLCLLAQSEESGVGVVTSGDGRDVYVTGHLEYAADTLQREYRRDRAKGLAIAPPRYYYHHDDPERGIDFSWARAAERFYANWVRGIKA